MAQPTSTAPTSSTSTTSYELHDFAKEHRFAGKFIDGWSLVGLTVLQSGQPYSVIDFSGAIGSIYYSTADGITNPIVPLAPGCTAKTATTGASGAWTGAGSVPALNAACFTLPLLPAGGLNGAIPTSDPYETGFTNGQRNIFRQAFQKRADASLVKDTKITERFDLKYTFDVYNLTNTTSFDVPGNEVSQNAGYNAFPTRVNQCLAAGGCIPSLWSRHRHPHHRCSAPDPNVPAPGFLAQTLPTKEDCSQQSSPLFFASFLFLNSSLLFPDILIPNLRMGRDIPLQQLPTFAGCRGQLLPRHCHAAIRPTGKVPALTHHERRKAKLTHQPAAIPARR